MRLRRLPPTAAPFGLVDLWNGLRGIADPLAARAALEAGLRSYFDASDVFLTSSGRAGLAFVLECLAKRSKRRTVVVPAYTCYSVAAAIERAGLEVALCDVDPENLGFDLRHFEILAAARPLAVVVTHLCGRTVDVSRIRTACRAYDVIVIDDAAQALGVQTASGLAGMQGDVGVLSFGRGKAVSGVSGGAVVTKSADLGRALAVEFERIPQQGVTADLKLGAEAIALFVFLRPWLYWLPAMLPFLGLGETQYSPSFRVARMTAFAAGLLRRWRVRLESSNAQRSRVAAALTGAVLLPVVREGVPYLRLPVLCRSRSERDRLQFDAHRRGLGFALLYPSSLKQIPSVSAVNHGAYPGADRLAECLLTVPVHPFVTLADTRNILMLLSSATKAGEAP